MFGTDERRPVFDHPFRALRILVVEDHGDTRRILSRLVTHFGHEIFAADYLNFAADYLNS